MLTEVAVSASSVDNVIHVWDIRSGINYATFKGNKCHAHGLSLTRGGNKSPGIIVAAQNDKALLNFWSWDKVRTPMYVYHLNKCL